VNLTESQLLHIWGISICTLGLAICAAIPATMCVRGLKPYKESSTQAFISIGGLGLLYLSCFSCVLFISSFLGKDHARAGAISVLFVGVTISGGSIVLACLVKDFVTRSWMRVASILAAAFWIPFLFTLWAGFVP
jgi:hypothetical protein